MNKSLLLLAALLFGTTSNFAAEPIAIAKLIDAEVLKKLQAEKLAPASISGDVEFMRRVYLDITGRIPTPAQSLAFLDSSEPNKRGKLIDELLASKEYGEQFGRTWRDWIAPPELPSEGNGGNQPIVQTQNFGKWFATQFNANVGWDRIVRDLLTVDGALKENPQALFYSLIGDDTGKPQPGGATRAITSLFLGVQMQCAECHNDPFKEWKQDEYWGIAAFFRTMRWKFNGRYFDSITESREAANPKDKKSGAGIDDKAPIGSITIPKSALKNSGKIVPARLLGLDTDVELKADQPLRSVFADWLTNPKNPYFAQAFVNRTWSYFFARGLIHSVDDNREKNPASHPELLKQLTQEFIASGHDVKHLVKCIVNSQTYQRTSKPKADQPSGIVTLFGQMPVRVMTADVLYDSLRLAMNDPKLDVRSYDSREASRFGESSPVGSPYDEFVKLFTTNEEDATDFTHGIPQLLAMMNHPRLRQPSKTIDDLLKAKATPTEAIEKLYLSTLSRKPTTEELSESEAFILKAKEPRNGYAALLWTLMNRSEFLLVR